MKVPDRLGMLLPFAITACTSPVSHPIPAEPVTSRCQIMSHGRARTFLVHSPPGELRVPVPVVLIFHGSDSSGGEMEQLTGFSQIADRERFLVVYPDGLAQRWWDGRQAPPPGVDDTAFVEDLLAWLGKRYPVNSSRIYAAGFSNGGIFVNYLAGGRAGSQFAAIAAVSGGIAEPVSTHFERRKPISVFLIHGDHDVIVPYYGGGVDFGATGRVVSTSETARLWILRNRCRGVPSTGFLPNLDPSDGCRVHWYRWGHGSGGSEVLLYSIEGGGHAWPGDHTSAHSFFFNRICRDFDASEAIWGFFNGHPS